jgi:hypothetical protein
MVPSDDCEQSKDEADGGATHQYYPALFYTAMMKAR